MSDKSFKLEEATIEQLHNAIRNGEVTCKQVVEKYIERARKYNGVSSMLVTENGESVEKVPGVERAQSELSFPTDTVKAAVVLPDLDKYEGPPIEYGRMEATSSDPEVFQQFGMITGIPDAGQVNALAT